MPKILILDPCLINYGDDRGGIHHDAGEMPDVPKATASEIVRMGRALYVSKSDDPDKAARSTASEAMVKAAQDMAAAKAKAAKAKAAEAKAAEAKPPEA